jgi:acetyltransferase-like isoleucine patch superfamily enzyme
MRTFRAQYLAGKPKRALKAVRLIAGWLFPFTAPNFLRIWLLKIMGAQVGRKVYIGRHTIVDPNYPELLTLEDNVMISYGCFIFMHDSSVPEIAVGKVVIKKGAYLGLSSVVLPDVTIGEGAVVGACALVTKDVAPHTTVVGIPAKPVVKDTGAR